MKTLIKILLILGTLPLWANVSLRLEVSPQKGYAGQPRLTYFWLESDARTIVEIEVSKFPEFRGFWSENMILRQGPVLLVKDPMQQGMPFLPNSQFEARPSPKFRALIGAYWIIPMLEKKDSVIEPMKLVLKEQGTRDSVTLLSEADPYENLPLPPVPAQIQGKFSGAIGSFHLAAEKSEIFFTPGEPSSIRLLLDGEGNFPEINELYKNFPDSIEVVSKNTFSQGSYVQGSKVFEVSITPKSLEKQTLELPPFIYFDSRIKKYAALSLPPFSLMPAPPRIDPPPPPMKDRILWAPVSSWSTSWQPQRNPESLWIQFIIALGILGATAYVRFQRIKALRNRDPKYLYRKRVEALQKSKSGKDAFLEESYSLVLQRLGMLTGIAWESVPAVRLLEKSEKLLTPAEYKAIEEVLTAYSHFHFSPLKNPPTLREETPAHVVRWLESA